jgi:hypothetical protein
LEFKTLATKQNEHKILGDKNQKHLQNVIESQKLKGDEHIQNVVDYRT